jgi:hypothetical protein
MTSHARKLPFAARFALTVAVVAVPFATGGCEDEVATSDRQVRASIDQSYLDANTGEGATAKVIDTLSQATAVQSASPLYKAQAQALLGQSSYTAAMEVIPDLNTHDVRIGQLLRQISGLSSRVLENTFTIDAMRGTNPTQPKGAFVQSRENFAKRLADLDKALAEAQKTLDAKAAQIKDLEAKRLAAANESTDLILKSGQEKGEASLKLYNQALEARQQASMLVHQLELANLDLARMGQAVAGLQSQRQAAEEGMKTAEQQAAKLDQGWSETQKLIEKRVEATKSIVTESGIASRAEELAKVSAEAETLRKQVNENLGRAIDAYRAADAAAVELDAEVGARIRDSGSASGNKALEALKGTVNDFTYNVAYGKALFARAHVAMSERSLLDARRGLAQRVVPIFQQAKLDVPAELSGGELDKRIDELTKQAGEDLKNAEEALNDVVERSPNEQDKHAARFMLMAVQYATFHLGDNANALANAQGNLKALLETTILLPALPSDLEQGVVTRAALPTTGPATPGTGGGGESTWLKVLQRASRPFSGAIPGGGDGPGAPVPPNDPNAPTEPTPQPAPGREAPTNEPPPGREPGGSLAPPTGIDL